MIAELFDARGDPTSLPLHNAPMPFVRCVWLACVLLSACAPSPLWSRSEFALTRGREHPLVGRVWSTSEHDWVTPEHLMAEVERASFVLLGETHDNPDHHRLQALLLDRFLTEHPRGAAVFEMLEEDQKSGLVDPVPASATELETRVHWAEHGWPDFVLYRPIFEVALSKQARIRVGHPARNTFLAAMRGEATPEDAALKLEPAISGPARDALIEEIREAHCGKAPKAMLEPMLRAQSFRDAWMARALWMSGGSAALIAGRGHVRKDRAVPVFLQRQGARAVLTVAFVGVDDDRKEPADYELEPFDFVVFTPRVSDESACERFKRQLAAMHKK